jgi:hypothetical protein
MIIIPISKDIIKYILSNYICYETYLDLKNEVQNLHFDEKRIKTEKLKRNIFNVDLYELYEIHFDENKYIDSMIFCRNSYINNKICRIEYYDCNEKFHGTCSQHNICGEYVYENYSHGVQHGEYSAYLDKDKKIILRKIYYKNGKLDGEYIIYNTNGKQREKKYYKNGKLHGEYIKNYSNGSPEERGSYKNGKLHGRCKRWYYSGYIYSNKIYNNGIVVKDGDKRKMKSKKEKKRKGKSKRGRR